MKRVMLRQVGVPCAVRMLARIGLACSNVRVPLARKTCRKALWVLSYVDGLSSAIMNTCCWSQFVCFMHNANVCGLSYNNATVLGDASLIDRETRASV